MERSCFFIGHRTATDNIKPLLADAIERHIVEYGVKTFYVGHYGRFDAMAAGALAEAKKKHPHIINYLLLAYHPAIRPVEKPDGFESTLLLEGQEKTPQRYAITRLNNQIIREVDYLIAYVCLITDGSHKLFDTARAREKRGQLCITNLAEQIQ